VKSNAKAELAQFGESRSALPPPIAGSQSMTRDLFRPLENSQARDNRKALELLPA
jgi:hypothetical protein